MKGRERSWILLHGAVVVLVGFVCGLAAVVEEMAGAQPQVWRAAHAALLLAGVWLLAMAAVLPLLVLPAREKRGLVAALLATAYGFTTAILVQAATGVRAIGPGDSIATWVAFVANLIAVLGSFLAALLTLVGAWGAVRHRD